MVAVIHASSSFRRVLNYNEQKVGEGVASCIDAAFYLKDAEDLSFNQKLARLQQQASLNTRTKVNCVHISLNFDPSEKHSDERLREITATYMDKIGFGGQPYLLYQHFDSGHPHVHVLTTNIKPDGKRIELHNLGKIHSEKARKEIEIDFNLVKAEDSNNRNAYELKPVNAKVQYGKSATKRAIVNVLNYVLDSYNYSTLAELNAVLNLYNVAADRGSKTSRVFLNNGLVYRIKNEDGEMQGVPIKASDFHSQPTLQYLEKRFLRGSVNKHPYKNRVKNSIDMAMRKPGMDSLNKLMDALKSEGIHTVLRENDDGILYGITYVDHRHKCVFNGSDLGKNYSAKGILEHFAPKQIPEQSLLIGKEKPLSNNQLSDTNPPTENGSRVSSTITNQDSSTSLLREMMEPEHGADYIPYDLSGKKKRKKKRKINNN